MMGDVTLELHRLSEGDRTAIERLLPLVYSELKGLASQKLRRERVDHTFQTTDLVHEVYVRLTKSRAQFHCTERRQFFGLVAEMMRHLLIDSARAKKAKKRPRTIQSVGNAPDCLWERDGDAIDFDLLLDLDNRLTFLEKNDPLSAEVVKLRLFSGLSFRQIAETLEISKSRAHEEWGYARCWLAKLASPESGQA